MDINQKIASSSWGTFLYWTVALSASAGFILSILAWAKVCSTACSAAHDYRFFGMPFEWIGVAFFAIIGILHGLSLDRPALSTYVGWMAAGALGAEIVFIGIQKFVIGGWCPICLSIAAMVAIIVLAYSVASIKRFKKDLLMKHFTKSLTPIALLIVGFFVAFVGVAKPVDAADNATAIVSRLEMGNKNSDIKVYFITDWFCPACKKTEPEVANIFSAIQGKVGFFFVDLAVHANTANYTPYNIAFMVNDQAKYLAIRHELDALSYEQDSPTDEQMEAIAKKLHVPFHEMSFREIKTAMKFYDQIADKYNVDKTPTMVIENAKTSKKAILNGTAEITLPNVQKTIESLAK